MFIALFYLGTDMAYHNWTRNKPAERGVIHWDIISYYAYLPATFIYGDPTLGFLDDPPEGFVNDDKFWAYTLENGNRLIVTSLGMAVLYAPGFFMAHALAPLFGEHRDGYGSIYQLFLVMISLVYVILGFIILKNLLLRHFNRRITAWTLLATALGTNLYYYATHEAPMAHASSFFLILLFLWLVDRWYRKHSILNTLLTGALLGFIALVRPSNILVFFILLLYGVTSFSEFRERILFFIKKFHLVLIMLAGFFLAWLPQFLYWHAVTGQFIFYSYGPHGGKFFFGHPHIIENLFSFKKGWFIYAPLMVYAMAGIPLLRRNFRALMWPVVVLLVAMIYVQSSWWCWWFGGSFGMRAYVELMGILAFPLAASFEAISRIRKRWLSLALAGLAVFMVLLQQINTYQYKNHIIHFNGMNRVLYWKSFMKFKTPAEYWVSLTLPDYELARKGIYVFYHTGNRYEALKAMGDEEGIAGLVRKIEEDRKLRGEVKRYARRSGISAEDAIQEVAARMYQSMINM